MHRVTRTRRARSAARSKASVPAKPGARAGSAARANSAARARSAARAESTVRGRSPTPARSVAHARREVEQAAGKHGGTIEQVRIKRAYEPASSADGTRVLVDRLWPRGLKKSDAHIAQWLKEIAPSNELRKWFGHDPARWDEFRRRYESELSGKRELLDELRDLARRGPLTLVYSAHDETHNQAVVLRERLLR